MIRAIDLLAKVEILYYMNEMGMSKQMESDNMQVKIQSHIIKATETIGILQQDVTFAGILGGFVGRYIKHHMDTRKIKSDVIWAEIETPHQITMVPQDTGEKITLNKRTNDVDPRVLDKIEQTIKNSINPKTSLLIEGRISNGVCPSIYKRLIELGKHYSAKTVMTTNQHKVLDAVLPQAPYCLMFTMKQLKELGIEHVHVEEIVKQLQTYLNQGVHYVAVDLEDQGGLLLSKSKFCYIEPMINEVRQWTRESSAAFLGALTVGIDRKYEQERIAKLCVAAGFACQQKNIKGAYNKNTIDQLLNKVKVRELSKN